jgi:hypothetical protein
MEAIFSPEKLRIPTELHAVAPENTALVIPCFSRVASVNCTLLASLLRYLLQHSQHVRCKPALRTSAVALDKLGHYQCLNRGHAIAQLPGFEPMSVVNKVTLGQGFSVYCSTLISRPGLVQQVS